MADRIDLRVDGDEAAERALGRMGGQADDALGDALVDIAEQLGNEVRGAARSDRAPQSRLLVPTIDVDRSGAEPSIVVGGNQTVGRRRTPAHDVLFGAEYGSNRYAQFQRTRSSAGYFITPAIETSRIPDREFDEAADDVVKGFERGG